MFIMMIFRFIGQECFIYSYFIEIPPKLIRFEISSLIHHLGSEKWIALEEEVHIC